MWITYAGLSKVEQRPEEDLLLTFRHVSRNPRAAPAGLSGMRLWSHSNTGDARGRGKGWIGYDHKATALGRVFMSIAVVDAHCYCCAAQVLYRMYCRTMELPWLYRIPGACALKNGFIAELQAVKLNEKRGFLGVYLLRACAVIFRWLASRYIIVYIICERLLCDTL